MPKISFENRIKQIFRITVHAFNGTVGRIDDVQPVLPRTGDDIGKGLLAQCRIVHNTMLAESLPTDFKLRLDQQHHLSAGSGDARNHRNHIGQ